jgi:hypothetical protein
MGSLATGDEPMSLSSSDLLILATLAMLVSLIAQNITLASGRYFGAFLVSIAALVAAGYCCWVVFRRGGWARWVAVMIVLPSWFVVLDWLRRLPGMLAPD